MKKYCFIFPNGTSYESNIYNHRHMVIRLLGNLSLENVDKFSSLAKILVSFYKEENGYNYDDFAIFSLGFIKITYASAPTICFAGYPFQYDLIDKIFTKSYKLDIVPNTNNYPRIIYKDVDYVSLICKN